MYTGTTKAFQSKIVSDSRTFRAKLVCDNDVIDSGFRSLKLTNKSVSGDTLEIGAAVSAQLDVTVKKPGFMITGREFQLYIGLVMGKTIEYVPMGKFKPQKPKETDSGEISFTAYDRMVSVFKSAYFTDIKSSPVDRKKILGEIQTKTGITVANLDTLPDGIMVDWRTEISNENTKKVYPFQGYTYNETIGYLAQLYGKFATINRDGNLELRWYEDCTLKAAANRITSDIESSELLFEVQKIECEVEDKTFTAGSGTMGIVMSNPVMTQKILNSIYKAIGGMKYLPTSCTYLGDPRLDLGDIIKVYKTDGTAISVPVMSIEYEYDGGLIATIESIASEEQTEIQKGPTATALDRVYTELFLVKSVIANKVTADYVEANYVSTKELDAVSAKVKDLETDNVQINNSLTVMSNAQVTFKNQLTTFEGKVNINEAAIKTLKGDFASFKEGEFEDLSANVAKIHTLIYGSAAGESISSQFSNSVIANVGTGMIKDAMIESLSVGKILAGKISTTKFQIISDSGNMKMSDNTMQIRDTKRTRIQIGKDAAGDYNMYVWDKSGNLMFDALGLTEDGIQRSIIRNDMVSDDADISAEKLDINTLFNVINADGSNTLSASKIYVDADKQTLDVSFKQMTTKVSESVTTATTAKTTASSALSTANTASTNASSAIKTANTANTAASNAVTTANSANSTANAAKSSADSALSKADTLETTISTLTTKVTTQGTQLTAVQGQISSKIWQQDITTAVSQIEIGGRNLLINTNSPKHTGKISWGENDIIYLNGCENDNYGGLESNNTVTPTTHGYCVTVGSGQYAAYYINGYSLNNNGGMGCLKKGETYTISFDYVVRGYSNDTDSNTKYVRLAIYGNRDSADAQVTMFNYNFATYTGSNKGSKLKGRCEYTFTIPNTTALSYVYFKLFFTASGVHASTDYIVFRNIKLEKGNRATDWTPAPEDMDSSITELEGTTSTLTTQYTTINQSLTSLKASVNSNTTAISKKADGSTVTTLQSTVTSLTADLKGFKTTVSDTYATTDAVDEKADKKSIISQINQTAEKVKIDASKIELAGKVTFSCFDSNTQTLINTADSNASTAKTTADAAKKTASTANTTATTAKNTADTAKTTADTAKTTADATDKVIAAWCYNNDKTYINGGKIYTGTITSEKIAAKAITADKINVSDLSALKASIGGFTIGSNYLHSATKMTSGQAATQYLTQLTQYSGKDGYAIHVANRSYDGESYGSWSIPFFVKYDGSMFSSKGKIGGFSIAEETLSCANAMVSGKAETQYQARMIAVGNVTGETAAFNTRKRNYDGSSYGSWGNTFYVRYDGYIAAYGGGRIGSWYLGAGTAGALYNGMTSMADITHDGVYLGSDGVAFGKGNFKVSKTGAVTANGISCTKNLTVNTADAKTGGIYTNGNISCIGNIVSTSGSLNVNGGITSGGAVKGTYGTFSNTLSTSAGGASITGNLYVSGYATLQGGYGTSDRRLKQDIKNVSIDNAIVLLEKLNPKTYRMTNDVSVKRVGFIAQDVQKVLLDNGLDKSLFVGKIDDPADQSKESYLTLNYSDLIGILWKGWQILNEKVKKQDEVIAQMKKYHSKLIL